MSRFVFKFAALVWNKIVWQICRRKASESSVLNTQIKEEEYGSDYLHILYIYIYIKYPVYMQKKFSLLNFKKAYNNTLKR